MNNYTDTQLKQALAKMLSDKMRYEPKRAEYELPIWWFKETDSWRVLLDTELLHLCWLVEEALDGVQQFSYVGELAHSTTYLPWNEIHATWQQRVIALAKVKGVEIV